MRQKRAKAYRKLMALYSMTFGFRQPYQVLIDSHMCIEAMEHNIDLVKQLGVVLQGTVKPMITQCSIQELYPQEKTHKPAVELAKTFERRKCNHRTAIPGDECLSSVVGQTNKHRYVIATQSQHLRQNLRAIPAVPIVHVNRSVMILEPPSDITLRAKALEEEKSLHPSTSEAGKVSATTPAEQPQRKKRHGPKGPNPLSVKKKKPQTQPEPSRKAEADKSQAVGEKRKRDGDDETSNAPDPDGHKRKRRRKHRAGVNTSHEHD